MNLSEAIRKAIVASGGRATSSLIFKRLRQAGIKANAHDMLKALRLPEFILTNRGWCNDLRQVELFSEEELAESRGA